jgi:hypothetical protein
MRKLMTQYEREVFAAERAAAQRREPTPARKWQKWEDFFSPVGGQPRLDPTEYLARWDGRPCPYCGHEMRRGTPRPPTRDHKMPRSRGILSKFDVKFNQRNILIVCRPCNGNKGNKTLEEFAKYLTAHGDPRAGFVWNLIDRGG